MAATAVAATPVFARRSVHSLARRSFAQAGPTIDAARLRNRLERLSYHGRTGASFADGVTRVAYSVADLTARAWIIDEMKQAEIAPRIDAAGNIYGAFWRPAESAGDPVRLAHRLGARRRQLRRRPGHVRGAGSAAGSAGGKDPDAPSARNGAVGARREHRVWHRHRGEPHRGRRSQARRHGQGLERHGRGDAIRRIAGDPDKIETAVRGKGAWHSYVELHIEQGGTLDKAKMPSGLSKGSWRFTATTW